MSKHRVLSERAERHFETAVSKGRQLLGSLEEIADAYERFLECGEKIRSNYSLDLEISLISQDIEGISDAVNRAEKYLRSPSQYFKLPTVERDEDSSDYDPDAVMDEILQHADITAHHNRIREITKELTEERREKTEKSFFYRIGKTIRKFMR